MDLKHTETDVYPQGWISPLLSGISIAFTTIGTGLFRTDWQPPRCIVLDGASGRIAACWCLPQAAQRPVLGPRSDEDRRG
ncbi:hypothetical protein BO71DRAFT_394417 [Aspergillus ellipticus CBS 707.79]|uniref:Uncharacterized protein n=1 Tax=Aspergillus ellipticus CBS 707.79 TaxID=1448320 RepID=A0A319DYR6_9EURO|nr:hypothetical protein BO71DRAFT_394417 [Aspergillus ellipticus CBS 707.79]